MHARPTRATTGKQTEDRNTMAIRISELTDAGSLGGDELLEVSKLSTSVDITATTISAQASDNSFNDSGAGFVAAGFAVGDSVNVQGFTGNVANNIATGRITALTTSKMTIGGTDGDVIVDDAAGESVTITKWESARATAQDIADLGGGSGGSVDVQVFDASGTWNKPSGAVLVRVIAIGGGGPGGGGSRRSGANTTGAGAGGGGARLDALFDPAALGSSETVTVATARTGGAGGTVDGNNGGVGSNGGDSSFGSHLVAYGGGAGAYGGPTAGAGGGGGGARGAGSAGSGNTGGAAGAFGGGTGGGTAGANDVVTNNFAGGGGSGTTGGAVNGVAGASTGGGGPGGGSGGGSGAGTTVYPGGAGGVVAPIPSTAAAGGTGSGGAGADGAAPTSLLYPGTAGGGGAGGGTGAGGNGGNGGIGAGGGGGGTSAQGNGGNGGNGGPGRVVVITYL
jgi:hypothetical protein